MTTLSEWTAAAPDGLSADITFLPNGLVSKSSPRFTIFSYGKHTRHLSPLIFLLVSLRTGARGGAIGMRASYCPVRAPAAFFPLRHGPFWHNRVMRRRALSRAICVER